MFAGPIKRGVAEATNTNDKIWSKLILNKRYRGAKSKLNSNYNRGIVDHDQVMPQSSRYRQVRLSGALSSGLRTTGDTLRTRVESDT